jgi:PPK2 family polyphosphate:nucleotide phosphotransferase
MAKTGWTDDPRELLRVGAGFALGNADTATTPGFRGGKRDGAAELAAGRGELNDLQARLLAESRFGGTRSLLLVLQAMDTAGKGGVVEHVIGGINPEGLRVHAFTRPTPEEQQHDFLWRVRRELPSAGLIGVFDRSHYEDVLVARVHALAAPEVIEQRYGQIVDFERELVAENTTIVKVMLHIGIDEQRSRLERRLDRVDKQWKYSPGDLDERVLWPDYQRAYQVALERTSTDDAPWYVVPADHRWYARVAVQRLLLEALRGMALDWPVVDYDVEAEKRRLSAL